MDADLKNMAPNIAKGIQGDRDTKRLRLGEVLYSVLREFNADQLAAIAELRRESARLALYGTDDELVAMLANVRNVVHNVVSEMPVIDMYDKFNKYVK